MAAVNQNSNALDYAADNLKSDKEVIIAALNGVSSEYGVGKVLEYAASSQTRHLRQFAFHVYAVVLKRSWFSWDNRARKWA